MDLLVIASNALQYFKIDQVQVSAIAKKDLKKTYIYAWQQKPGRLPLTREA